AADAGGLEAGDVVVGDDAAAEDDDVARAFGAQRVEDGGEKRVVRAAHDRKTHGVDVLLDGGVGDHVGRLVKTRVDDLEAGVAKGARDDLRASVVTVEPRLRNQ